MGQTLPILENIVTSLLDTNERIIRNIMDAAMGRVTTSLFPVEDFRHALEIGRTVYKLIPFFNDHMILPISKACLKSSTGKREVVTLPMVASTIFLIILWLVCKRDVTTFSKIGKVWPITLNS